MLDNIFLLLLIILHTKKPPAAGFMVKIIKFS